MTEAGIRYVDRLAEAENVTRSETVRILLAEAVTARRGGAVDAVRSSG